LGGGGGFLGFFGFVLMNIIFRLTLSIFNFSL